MEVVDGDQAGSDCLLGYHQEVEACLGVVTTGLASTVRVNGAEGSGTTPMLQVYLPPGHEGYATSLQQEREHVCVCARVLTAVRVG